jgi:nickel superoxide dismutase
MRGNNVVGCSIVGLVIVATGSVLVHQAETNAHCQVPCGIYDDAARIKSLREDATTIAKAVAQVSDLASQHDAQAINQAIRWVMTKEEHASHIIEVVSQYFLTQKVKPKAAGSDDYNAYLALLADHHAVMVAAMKTKQSSSAAPVADLVKAIDKLATHY